VGEPEPHSAPSVESTGSPHRRTVGVRSETIRILPVSMLVIGLILLGGFIVASTSMIAAVVASDGNGMPDIDQLPLPSGVDIVDTHAACDANECAGYGMVVGDEGTPPGRIIELIQSRLRSVGWGQRDCAPGEVCMRRDDLGVVMRPWSAVAKTEAVAVRSALEDRGIDQASLVYVLYHRCSDLHPCP